MKLQKCRAGSGHNKSQIIVVRVSPLDRRQAIMRLGPLCFRAALGRGGMATRKREGDGATPRAEMAVLTGFRRGGLHAAVSSLTRLERVGKGDGWCDAPGHPAYNQPVRLPFSSGHEALLRDDHLYDLALVLDWNIRRRVRGLGSAIFLHVARENYQPTEGCVALKLRDLALLIKFIRRGDRLRIGL